MKVRGGMDDRLDCIFTGSAGNTKLHDALVIFYVALYAVSTDSPALSAQHVVRSSTFSRTKHAYTQIHYKQAEKRTSMVCFTSFAFFPRGEQNIQIYSNQVHRTYFSIEEKSTTTRPWVYRATAALSVLFFHPVFW